MYVCMYVRANVNMYAFMYSFNIYTSIFRKRR